MAINWSSFQNRTISFFRNNSNQNRALFSTANHLTDTYILLLRQISISQVKGTALVAPPPNQILFRAWNTCLNSNFKKTTPLSAIDYRRVGEAIIGLWSQTAWRPLPVPPGYVSPTRGYTINNPGDINTLIQNLSNTLKIQDPIKLATKLENTYKTYFRSISGSFEGLVPGAPSPVLGPPFLWAGLI